MTKVRKMKDQTEYQKESLNNAFRFLANLNPVLDCYVVGIDIGADGGIFIFDITGGQTEAYSIIAMPYVQNTKTYPIIDIYDFIKTRTTKNKKLYFIMENVHAFPGQGSVSMFSFGKAFGILQSLVELLRSEKVREGIDSEVFYINPRVWTSYYFPDGLPKQKEEKKKLYFVKAIELYPKLEQSLLKKSGKNFHSGKVDALLLAEFLRRALLKDSCFFLVIREGVKYAIRGAAPEEYILSNLDIMVEGSEAIMKSMIHGRDFKGISSKNRRELKKDIKQIIKAVTFIQEMYNKYWFCRDLASRLYIPKEVGGNTGVWLHYEDSWD